MDERAHEESLECGQLQKSLHVNMLLTWRIGQQANIEATPMFSPILVNPMAVNQAFK